MGRLSDEFEVREVRLRLTCRGPAGGIWTSSGRGQAMSTETVMAWELEPRPSPASSPLTVRDVIERHDGEIWLQAREKPSTGPSSACCCPLPRPGSRWEGGFPEGREPARVL
ncbi:hypothetical protein [Zoogloea sp.]|uniref:hypothetical protein n=1 Tax=Zoogloea sp. TaxID=49181 RepID=UPI001D9AA3C5|nr:hypothetical protein [Zoogloea sp.]MBK6654760.1 hypothetical protein [Zoogloea sp.]